MIRVRRTFVALVAIAVVATGALSNGLAAPSGPATGALVALSGLVLSSALALAVRILTHLGTPHPKEPT